MLHGLECAQKIGNCSEFDHGYLPIDIQKGYRNSTTSLMPCLLVNIEHGNWNREGWGGWRWRKCVFEKHMKQVVQHIK